MAYRKKSTWVSNKRHKRTRKAKDEYAGKICDCKLMCGGERLSLSSFRKNASKPDGLRPTCKDCEVEYRRNRKQRDKRVNGRYKLTPERLNRPTNGKAVRDERLKKFRATGVYDRWGRVTSEKRIAKDRAGKGRIKGQGSWREPKPLIY